jgi:hypothetical protein
MDMSPETRTIQNPLNFFRAIAISAAIILLWVTVYLVQAGQAGTPGSQVWGFISIIALLATIISPLAYGWYSRDPAGAVIIGALPFLLVVGVSSIISGSGQHDLIYPIVYFLLLCLAGGLEGYFAAKRTTGYLVIALILAGIWVGIFLSGIH